MEVPIGGGGGGGGGPPAFVVPIGVGAPPAIADSIRGWCGKGWQAVYATNPRRTMTMYAFMVKTGMSLTGK